MNKSALIHVENTENLLELSKYLSESGWKILSANKTEEFLKQQNIPVVRETSLVENNFFLNDTSALIKKVISTKMVDESLGNTNPSPSNGDIYLICMNVAPSIHFHLTDPKIREISKPFSFYISSIIRNAFINYENIIILTDPADYKEAIIQLRTNSVSKDFRRYLAAKALNSISSYDSGISFSLLNNSKPNEFMNNLMFPFTKQFTVRSSTNLQNNACLYTFPINSGAACSLKKAKAKELDFNIITDISLAWEQISMLCTNLKNQYSVASTTCDGYKFSTQFTPQTGIVFTIAVKYKNILGAALYPNAVGSFKRTYNYNSEDITDAVLGCSSVIDKDAAQEIINAKIIAIVAPDFTEDAKQILAQNKNIQLIPTSKITCTPYDVQLLNGGLLFQLKDSVIFDQWYIKTKNRPSQYIADQMVFGTMLTMGARTHCSILLKENTIIAIAQGCKSSNLAVKEVLQEALINNHDKIANLLVCDTPISLTDSIKELIDKGLEAIIQPGNTSCDQEFIQYCNEHNVTMVFTGKSHISY